METVTPRSNSISVVVPTFNEASNVEELVKRISAALEGASITYEIIFIDDHSNDDTIIRLEALQHEYPLIIALKEQQKGKSYSLLQGFAMARYDVVAMIDADLQYAPEAIPEMLQGLNEGADIVLANRLTVEGGRLRRFASRLNRSLTGKIIWGLDVDIQTGLKVFRRSILNRFVLNPKTPWTFDLEFLVRARSGGYRIFSHDVNYAKRLAGETNVRLLSDTPRVVSEAVKLKFQQTKYVSFSPEQIAERGEGFHYAGDEYIPHNRLAFGDIALQQLIGKQRLILTCLALLIVACFVGNWHASLSVLIASLSVLYFGDLLFNLNLIIRSLRSAPDIKVTQRQINRVADTQWPRYTVLCPMYREANVLPQFVQAIKALDYDHSRLQVLLLLEANDEETIDAAKAMNLPEYFEIVVVPLSMPKTKPKACNYGLARANGEYVVIYDAEDVPDPLQLKQAYLAFKNSPPSVACVQCKLNFYNPHQNLLTRAFTAEYSLWFDLILPGMQHTKAPIPLGGTSNHFKAETLRELGGWDAFNVTEDADLGMRLVKRSYQTRILDSTTYEEANSKPRNWFWQRSRWIKGYLQTYFVHSRNLKEFRLDGVRNRNSLLFQLVIGGKVLSMLINPIMWLLTISYFVFRATVGPSIESFYPMPVLYVGVLSLIFGNFLYMYYYMIGCARRQQYELIKYALFIPLYWVAMSAAAYYALIEFIYKPHHWRKTAHGLHLPVDTNSGDVSLSPQTAQGQEA